MFTICVNYIISKKIVLSTIYSSLMLINVSCNGENAGWNRHCISVKLMV